METDPKLAEARRHVRALKGFLSHALVFSCVMSGLFGLNSLTKTDWWVQWPLLGWGTGLLVHAMLVFTPFRLFGREWEEQKIQEHLRRQQP